MHGRDNICIYNFGRKLEGRRPLGRLRRRLEYIIRMNFREIVWKDVDWMYPSQVRDQQGACEHSNETSSSIKGREFLD